MVSECVCGECVCGVCGVCMVVLKGPLEKNALNCCKVKLNSL